MLRSVFRAALIGLLLCLAPSQANAQQATTYSYDALGRLNTVLQSAGPASGNAVTYTYDAAGNRTNYLSTQNAGISISGASANEGSALTFMVSRSGTTANVVTVNYATSNGTAVSGTNYTSTSGTLSFAAGVTSQAITVATIDDQVVTSSLSMGVTLSSPSGGATIDTASATGTINNIDTAAAPVALNPTINLGSAASTLIALLSLANTNGQAATVTAFTPSSGGGSASIAGDGQSVSYTAPVVAKAAPCEPSYIVAVTAAYTVKVTSGGATANGTVTFKVKGGAGGVPIGGCP
jgi:hypothetical protein